MANTALTASIVAKEALVILENELAVINKMHRAHEEEFDKKVNGYKVGADISIRRPADFVIRTGAVMATQDVIEGAVTLSVDQQCGVDFQFTSTELTLRIEELSERVIKPAMSTIVNHITSDCLTQMYRGIYNWAGTPGQVINSFADFSKGPERLDLMSVPMQSRTATLSTPDHWGLLGAQTGMFVQDAARGAYRSRELGEIGGVDTMMSQVVPTHTVGPLGGTPVVNGAAQNVTYDAVKNTWAQSLITDGWTAAAATRLNVGDVFTIAGIFMVNPKTKAVTAQLQNFVVNATVASDGAGNLTANISPPMITSGPHQTVNAAPADNIAITVIGTAATGYLQNMVFHKNTMALAIVPMEMPAAAYGAARESYKGINVRVIPVYDGTNDISKWRLDLLYGRKVIDPRLATRLSGSP